jgi:hypothetical protein
MLMEASRKQESTERAYAHRRFSSRRIKRMFEEDDDEQGVGSEHCSSTSSDLLDAKNLVIGKKHSRTN